MASGVPLGKAVLTAAQSGGDRARSGVECLQFLGAVEAASRGLGSAQAFQLGAFTVEQSRGSGPVFGGRGGARKAPEGLVHVHGHIPRGFLRTLHTSRGVQSASLFRSTQGSRRISRGVSCLLLATGVPRRAERVSAPFHPKAGHHISRGVPVGELGVPGGVRPAAERILPHESSQRPRTLTSWVAAARGIPTASGSAGSSNGETRRSGWPWTPFSRRQIFKRDVFPGAVSDGGSDAGLGGVGVGVEVGVASCPRERAADRGLETRIV